MQKLVLQRRNIESKLRHSFAASHRVDVPSANVQLEERLDPPKLAPVSGNKPTVDIACKIVYHI